MKSSQLKKENNPQNLGIKSRNSICRILPKLEAPISAEC